MYELEEDIIHFVFKAFLGLKRKKEDIDLSFHSIMVGNMLKNIGCDEETIFIGYLHDVIEDTKYTYEDILEKYDKNILVVVNTLYEANSLYKSLYFYSENDVYLFPMDDFLTSEALAISPDLMISRLETINQIVSDKKSIVITNLMGYLRYLPSKESWKNNYISIKKIRADLKAVT